LTSRVYQVKMSSVRSIRLHVVDITATSTSVTRYQRPEAWTRQLGHVEVVVRVFCLLRLAFVVTDAAGVRSLQRQLVVVTTYTVWRLLFLCTMTTAYITLCICC